MVGVELDQKWKITLKHLERWVQIVVQSARRQVNSVGELIDLSQHCYYLIILIIVIIVAII